MHSVRSISQTFIENAWFPSTTSRFAQTASPTECLFRCNDGLTWKDNQCSKKTHPKCDGDIDYLNRQYPERAPFKASLDKSRTTFFHCPDNALGSIETGCDGGQFTDVKNTCGLHQTGTSSACEQFIVDQSRTGIHIEGIQRVIINSDDIKTTSLTFQCTSPAISQLLFKIEDCQDSSLNRPFSISQLRDIDRLIQSSVRNTISGTLNGVIWFNCVYTFLLNFSDSMTPQVFRHYQADGNFIDLFEGPSANTFKAVLEIRDQ